MNGKHNVGRKKIKMKIKIIILASVFAIAAIGIIAYMQHRIKFLNEEAMKYKNNTEVLMQDVEWFMANDTLNAARVGALELKLSEYERYRASDAELINSLKAKNQDLKAVTTAQTATIQRIQAQIKDSVVYLPSDTIERLVRKINYNDKWITFNAVEVGDTFNADIQTRDSLLITETIQYKRFLGFLWKTNKIKKREYNIVSRNPHTKILGFEVVNIEK